MKFSRAGGEGCQRRPEDARTPFTRSAARAGRGRPEGSAQVSEASEGSGSEDCTSEEETNKSGMDNYYPSKFHGCFNTAEIGRLVSTFSPAALNLMDAIGLRGLKYLKAEMQYDRSFVYWLQLRIDCANMTMRLAHNDIVQLTPELVGTWEGNGSEAFRVVPESSL